MRRDRRGAAPFDAASSVTFPYARSRLTAPCPPARSCLATIGGMTIPSRLEAAALLDDLEPPDWLVAHSSAVAEIASFLARRMETRGISVDRRIVESAALLHDIDKLLPADHPLKPLGHGDAGARWLAERGYEELSRPVANHPVTRLSDETRYRRWASFASREERIVAYADKRARQRIVSLEDRFEDWAQRYPAMDGAPAVGRARARADRLERDVCSAAGVAPDQVGRLRWAGPALARAQRERTGR